MTNYDEQDAEASNNDDEQTSPTIDSSPVNLEEFPLPRMFVPGKIVHIYTHRGGYKVSAQKVVKTDTLGITLANMAITYYHQRRHLCHVNSSLSGG
jgi:hypothetical protein